MRGGIAYSFADMLHNFMITSGRGAIVLYRKQFTKALKNPRLIAGLVTALCDFSIGSGVGLPVNIIELDEFTVTVVEMADDDVEDDRDCFRAVLFHDNSDVRAAVDSSAKHPLFQNCSILTSIWA